jgi:hypothetical protein
MFAWSNFANFNIILKVMNKKRLIFSKCKSSYSSKIYSDLMNLEQIHKQLNPKNKENLIRIIKLLRSKTEENSGKRALGIVLPKEVDQFVKSLSKALQTKYISHFTIESECISFLREHVESPIEESDLELGNKIENLQERLEQMIGEWRVIVPLDYLVLEKLDIIRIGKIDLIPFNKLEEQIIYENSRAFGANEINKRFIEDRIIYKKFNDKVCACLDIVGEGDILYQDALNEVENIVNLLRIYAQLTTDSRFIRIGVNEGWVAPLSLFCFRKDKPGGVFIPTKADKFKMNYTITKEIYESFKSKYYLNDINKILNLGSSRSEYDEEIVTAIRWIGMGIQDTVISDKFLKFAIALECLLLGRYDKKDEILAKRCAYLLKENNINREMISLYDKRSRIVHNGITNIESSKADRLLDLVIRCLFKILDLRRNQINIHDKKDLINYFDKYISIPNEIG